MLPTCRKPSVMCLIASNHQKAGNHMQNLPFEANLALTIFPGTEHHITFTWRKTGERFMCYVGLPGVNKIGRLPVFDTHHVQGVLSIMNVIYDDSVKWDTNDERAKYKAEVYDRAITK